ncbi:MAG: UDP-2,4-diacetamido-2,4,6-trideoxy-beta-L-altropyranose hydrolase [Pseudomonas sp.]|nr:UDP-2,4-diacetamido-2,4,6-trideoxy-beta-L-altropyranose hydrolase [Pseudomonas sp.]
MNAIRIAFRADASLQMGTGHVMRCLTLADALSAQGADCLFICREHQGNLIEQIRNKGYRVNALPVAPPLGASPLAIKTASDEQSPAHSHWLGATQVEDAVACVAILADVNSDWLIVDHYALDASWELALKPHYRKLMVIDDLADRPHLCDLLLDQTFGRDAEDYRALVPTSSQLLCGSQYALLRPEFAALRDYSLQRRANPQLHQLLITMGGIDKDNATGRVLEALRGCSLPEQCQITVVMGTTAPWLAEVSRKAQSMPWPTTVMVGVSDMAQLMADSDLAIGAAGATSWERCCLGLPTVMVVLAENQKTAAVLLEEVQAVLRLNTGANLAAELRKIIHRINCEKELLKTISVQAARITDGAGCLIVASKLES